MSINLNHSDAKRYLTLLGITESEPSLDALTRIVRAQMVKVPFENISKLYRLKTTGVHGLINLELFLDGIERYHFGGTCYSNNYHLHQLLKYLGFDVVLCGADMSKPDVHMVNIVRVTGREYIVDVGYAAPFLEPLPRDLPVDYVITQGIDQYILNPMDAAGRSQLKLYRNGTSHHGYLVNPIPRTAGHFTHVIADSFRPDATFMNSVLLVRFDSDASQVIHNMTCIESKGTVVRKHEFTTINDLITAIENIFGIQPAISRIALEGLSMRQDAWS